MVDKIFYVSCFGFLAGVLLRSFVLLHAQVILLVGLIALACLLCFLLLRQRGFGFLLSIFICAFSLGMFRFHVAHVPAPERFETEVGKGVSLAGYIVDEPVITDKNQRLVVEIENKRTKVLLSVGFEKKYSYGDEIAFEGKLKKPENFETDQGKEFDYVNYLRKDGIFYVMSYPEVQIISRGHGNKVKSALFFIKEKFLQKINFAVAPPESLLLGGLILGERAAFSDELRQDFIDTGTIHIVALSGYNVTIVAEWIMKILAFLSKNAAFGVGAFSIFIFVLMTGASSTAVRAGIMAVLALIARATGRVYDVARALVVAAILMVVLNPFILAYDVSFQLSVLATIAIIFLAPKIERYFLWVTKGFNLRDIASATVAAYVFVFPFILYKMGNFSLVALPANFLVLPFIPATMAMGFMTGLAGFVWYGLAVPFGFIAYLLLHYELGIIRALASLSFASVSMPDFPLATTIAIYAWFIYFLFGRNVREFFKK